MVPPPHPVSIKLNKKITVIEAAKVLLLSNDLIIDFVSFNYNALIVALWEYNTSQ
ncbi:hypothetical protein DGWBC_0117 [Dehalogenimonas sp. WBC-2]|nr:hypothetical protein DGWBC_0117 [Dehalogenimonas sp. WBC-2]